MPTFVADEFSLLVIDDDPLAIDIVKTVVSPLGLKILTATDAETGLALIKRKRPHILLVDIRLPDSDGMQLIRAALDVHPDTFAMLMTAHYSTETAVSVIQSGACDYFEKPISPERLIDRVRVILGSSRSAKLPSASRRRCSRHRSSTA
ncbi:MAG: response regulator [Acidobacteriales bacterium]|nr:response regulator [Terriglobales bacterium]